VFSVKAEILQVSIFSALGFGNLLLGSGSITCSLGQTERRALCKKLRYSYSDFHIFAISLGQGSTDFSKA